MEAYIFRGKCVHVVDGDTIDVILDLGFGLTSKRRLRLFGVNTPEMHSELIEERIKAQQAKMFTTTAVLDTNVMVQTYKGDVFGRYLAKVFIPINETEYQCLNDLLLEEDLAVPFMTDTNLLS